MLKRILRQHADESYDVNVYSR